MKILKTRKDVDNFTELQRRKAELKAQIEREKAELQDTFQLVREDLKPVNIVKNAVGSLFGNDDKKPESESTGKSGFGWGFALQLLTDALIPNRRIARVVQTLGPAALALAPKLAQKASSALPRRAKIYGSMRKKIAALRSKLKEKKTVEPEPNEENQIFI